MSIISPIKKEWLEDLKSKLQGIKTFWVKFDIPLDVLEEREASRGTSPKGHARSHYDSVYWNIEYDYVVYPAVDSAQQIAVKLKSLL